MLFSIIFGYSLIENAVKAGQIKLVKLLLKHADMSIMMAFTRYRHPAFKSVSQGIRRYRQAAIGEGCRP